MGTEECSYEQWKHLENLPSVIALLRCHVFPENQTSCPSVAIKFGAARPGEDGGDLPP